MKPRDIALRAASAVVLAPAAVLATWAGGDWFCALVVAGAVLLAFEWARMCAPNLWRPIGVSVALALVVAVIAAHVGQISLALVLMVFGALIIFFLIVAAISLLQVYYNRKREVKL